MDCNGPYVSHYSQQLYGVTLKMFLERGEVMSTICIHGQLQLLNNKHKKGARRVQLITIRRAKP